MRGAACNLLAAFCERSEEDLTDYVDLMLQKLLYRFNDDDEVVLSRACGSVRTRPAIEYRAFTIASISWILLIPSPQYCDHSLFYSWSRLGT